jgi:hypothetical protein
LLTDEPPAVSAIELDWSSMNKMNAGSERVMRAE